MGSPPLVKDTPRWFRPALLALSAIFLIGLFSTEIADYDFWWTLRSGEYIAHNHRLPAPDPFAFTTALARDAYPGESVTRQFNLTFEWLAQLKFYSIYRLAGFGGIVWFRAVLLTACCALMGLIVRRRTGGFYRAWVAGLATAAVLSPDFAHDRSYLFTLLFLAITLTLLEYQSRADPLVRGGPPGRPLGADPRLTLLAEERVQGDPRGPGGPPYFGLWALTLIAVVWANCHGGFFLEWLALAAYCAESLYLRQRDRRLWLGAAISVAASGINPNGFRVIEVLGYFRHSFLQSKLLEWTVPTLWPLSLFSVLLFAGAGVMLWSRQRVRMADWLIFAAFAAAALAAQRNIFLIGFWAPVVIASYLPTGLLTRGSSLPSVAQFGVAALMLAGLGTGIARGSFFQFRVADWRFPSGAADFLLAHHVSAPLFNTYEFGGYLIWRLWPQERVFIDGRALSESIFNDYARILYNHSAADGGESAQQLLDQYGVQAIVMNGFEYSEGIVYNLLPALSGNQTEWKLVYNDPQAVVFMREPPNGVQALDPSMALNHMESECAVHLEHEPRYPLCARALGQVFSAVNQPRRARLWLGVYLSHPHEADAEAEKAYARLLSQGQ